ncbi:hypothetical protein AOR02nite_23480 [Acetobacter orientalis]|nr:hypothetical protein AOR02nite_23480 [Acetobacter orientalis]
MMRPQSLFNICLPRAVCKLGGKAGLLRHPCLQRYQKVWLRYGMHT